MKIPLYKLFLIQAAYAIALGALCRLGTVGIVSALVVGTALSGLILLVHRDSIRSVAVVGAGSIVGGFFGLGCLGQFLWSWLYSPEHLVVGSEEECALAGGIIGAVIGGLSVSFFSALLRKRGK